jgi:hypothetical protein
MKRNSNLCKDLATVDQARTQPFSKRNAARVDLGKKPQVPITLGNTSNISSSDAVHITDSQFSARFSTDFHRHFGA